ncbi:MAG TPA: prephenate dehydratase domain-containing protein, partial [Candidatus Lokiarchaeia archaeon]|nr:prephenate dehydratase domain-containing protein [Candidatus Lokiarchaeia archaeon]
KVLSHPQGLNQTREWLRKRLPNAEQIETSSTARAVEMIKDRPESAAISTALAAELYGLEVLESGIEDNPENYTRFLILSKQDTMPTGNDRTSITFVTKHVPGALSRVLQVFASRNINLLKIESRPRRESNLWEYSFFLDFEGHQLDTNIVEAIEEIDQLVIWKKILGSYPRFQ